MLRAATALTRINPHFMFPSPPGRQMVTDGDDVIQRRANDEEVVSGGGRGRGGAGGAGVEPGRADYAGGADDHEGEVGLEGGCGDRLLRHWGSQVPRRLDAGADRK